MPYVYKTTFKNIFGLFLSVCLALISPIYFQDWKYFGRICTEYVEKSNKGIKTLYKFLSEPIDSMTAAERKERQDEIIRSIDNEINEFVSEYDKTDDSSDI